MSAQIPNSLSAMRDHYRPLLVFDGGQADLAQRQLAMLAPHSSELRERQVLVVGVEASSNDLPTTLLSGSEDASARRRFHVGAGEFVVILLGKDGGEKLRSREPIPWQRLQETIDSMPMRQREMNGR